MDEKIAGELASKLATHFGEDIAQSVMVKILALREPPRNLEHYAFRAAKYLRVDAWRLTQRRPELPILAGADVMPAIQERRAIARQVIERTDPRLVVRAINGTTLTDAERWQRVRERERYSRGMPRRKRARIAAVMVLLGLPQMAVHMF